MFALIMACHAGCRQPKALTPEERQKLAEKEAKKAKNEQAKPDFEVPKLSSLPQRQRVSVKPGHWVTIRQELKPNNFDFIGEAICSAVTTKNVDKTLERSPFFVESSRPASLIKGQTKLIDMPVFISRPEMDEDGPKSIRIRSTLSSRNTGRVFGFGAIPTTLLQPHQFHVVVLADSPDSYGFLKTTTTIAPPNDDWSGTNAVQSNYLVSAPTMEDDIPLPQSGMEWTTTAFVIWDGADSDVLSDRQQTAMLDWLHWGGQLVISGPSSIEKLRSGFLSDYLPVKPGAMLEAGTHQLRSMDDYWSLKPQKRKDNARYQLSDGPAKLQVIDLILRDGGNGRFVPHTGDLVAEKRVGRGRIVVSAFRLADPAMVSWRSYDSFINGCLFQRPGRKFTMGRDGIVIFEWNDVLGRAKDALLSCNLRYFSRDAFISALRQDSDGRAVGLKFRQKNSEIPGKGDLPKDRVGFAADPLGGVAAWNDFSSAAIAARAALVRAAGISVPDRRFVARLLAAYLVFLVPINWLLFRLVGRPEWAWFVAPGIALIGALAVIRLAQLDIGFVRSRTEVAVLEMQEGYERAHLTRYIGLYTSLSSRYALAFADSTAVALPLSTDPSDDELRLAATQNVEFRQESQSRLQNVPIISNSTGLLHVEQMIDLEGNIRLVEGEGSIVVENDTPWALQSALLIRRDGLQYEINTLGTIAGGSAVAASELPPDSLNGFLDGSPVTSSRTPKGEVSLFELYRLAIDARQLEDGAVRLVAWVDVDFGELEIRPRSNQSTIRTLVVCSLKSGFLPKVRPDANLFEDFKKPELNLFDPINR